MWKVRFKVHKYVCSLLKSIMNFVNKDVEGNNVFCNDLCCFFFYLKQTYPYQSLVLLQFCFTKNNFENEINALLTSN